MPAPKSRCNLREEGRILIVAGSTSSIAGLRDVPGEATVGDQIGLGNQDKRACHDRG